MCDFVCGFWRCLVLGVEEEFSGVRLSFEVCNGYRRLFLDLPFTW